MSLTDLSSIASGTASGAVSAAVSGASGGITGITGGTGLVSASDLFTGGGEDEDGTDFDAISFGKSIYDVIDNFRSTVGPNYNELVSNPTQQGSGSNTEHRLNVFYRLLGLPATRDESIISSLKTNNIPNPLLPNKPNDDKLLTQGDTLNYFKLGELSPDVATKLRQRNNLLTSKATKDQYKTMIDNPLPPSSAIDNSRKASLFPLVVDAAVPVYPLNRRSAPLFYNGSFFISGGREKLTRPFLEHIIYMRTKAFSGAQTAIAEQMKKNIIIQTGDASLATLPDRFTLIEGIIVKKLFQGIKQSAQKYSQVVNQTTQLKLQVSFDPVISDNPNQRALSSTSSDPIAGAKTVMGKKIVDLNKRLSEQDVFLSSLPVESLNLSDRISSIEDGIGVDNLRSDVFISSFTNLISFERAAIEKQLEEAQNEERQKIQQLDQARRDIMLYSGEFTGLSILDILYIFYALFTIELKYLIGLLNTDAKDRLKADPFYSTNKQSQDTIQVISLATDIIDETVSVSRSLDALETQIITAINISNAFFLK